MKKFVIILVCMSLLIPPGDCWAMGGSSASDAASQAVSTTNAVGNNDAAQEAGGRLGQGIANYGSSQIDQAWKYTDSTGNLTDRAQNMANAGQSMFIGGKALEYGSKAAPHIGWVATSAGRAYEGDVSGMAIEGVNGLGRTLTIAKIGTAAGTAGAVWVGGKLGAVAGSWAGPLGAGAGFIIGCGAAYIGGKIWDNTIGEGASALDQKIKDWDAESEYGVTQEERNAAAQAARDNARDAASNVRDAAPSSGGSRPSGCGCGCSCGGGR